MAEINDNLTPEEVEFVESILKPLDKNPLHSEDLNPMAKIFRQKMGYAEPVLFESEEESNQPIGGESEEENFNVFSDESSEEDFSDSEPAPPNFKSFDEDDEIDLDELLGESTPSGSKILSEKPVSDFSSPESDFDSLTDFGSLAEETRDDEFQTASFEQDAIFPDENTYKAEPAISSQDDRILDDLDSLELGTQEQFQEEGSSPISSDFDRSVDDFGFGEEKAPADDFGFGEEKAPADDFSFGEEKAPADDFGFGEEKVSADDFDFGEEKAPADENFEFWNDTAQRSAIQEPSIADTTSGDPFAEFESDFATTRFDSDLGNFDTSTQDLEPPDLDEIGTGIEPEALAMDSSSAEAESLGEDGLLEDELTSLMQEEGAIDEGLTDEDLAIIQRELVKYPPRLRRQVIDSIVNNRIPLKNQKELIEIIKHQQPAESVAEYLSEVLGEKVLLRDPSGAYADDGVPIIATKPIYTKEGALRRRKLIKNTIFTSIAAILLISGILSLYRYVIIPGRASGYYEEGLSYIRQYAIEKDESEKKKLLRNAKEAFIKGEEINPHSLKYLNLYGIEYMKAGRYDESFEMLFGKLDPPFLEWSKRREVPYISIHPDSTWDDSAIEVAGVIRNTSKSIFLTSQDKVKRKILKAGAYIIARVKEDVHHIPTYLNLGRFHSYNARDFKEEPKNKIYKNDTLAIEYFRRVFTDANDPTNVDARAGIAKIYYNNGEFSRSASEYNKIVEIFPKSAIGHGGLLSSYIEIWRRDKNPQFVLNHHRNLRNNLGIEKDLSLFVLSKLASFYIDLDPEETRIRYNVTPDDQVSGMDLDDNADNLLNILFNKKEVVDGVEYEGNRYAEGYYQRGRLFLKHNEALRAMKQFELAASYDIKHYPAVLRMAEYYMYTNDFSEAENLLKSAERRYKEYRDEYGRRDEDETLVNGDPGKIYFNRGKILYIQSAGILSMDQIKEFPGRKIYPERAWSKIPDTEWDRRKRGLYLASEFFKLAETKPHVLQDPKKYREMIYYTGWIEYMLSNFQEALNRWNDLDEEDLYHNTTLLLGMGNASYYTRQYNSALGYYKKVMDDYEAKEAMIKRIVVEDQDHQEIYQILVTVYNNIGAVLETQGNNQEALAYYWKAIEAARKIELVSEIANSNKDLIIKKQRLGNPPLLEDWLSPTLDTLKDMVKM